MNAEPSDAWDSGTWDGAGAATVGAPLPDGIDMGAGFEALDDVKGGLGLVVAVLDELDGLCGPEMRERTAPILHEMLAFEPSVTMIGQVKAGKTALVSAMIGVPDLLPSDVNPWTSVVTSIHVNSIEAPEGVRARFRFFDEGEWDNLTAGGGRMGEMAARAGAESEGAAIAAQVAGVLDKARRRLGDSFELMLGQSHDYGYVDDELLRRYVCLGDDEGEGEGGTPAAGEDDGDGEGADAAGGRFADITRTADIFVDRPELPCALCIRDTPGVNDTFMMREQVTLKAIRGSELCVVVLSAQQALTTADMAILRMISAVKKRQVVIFVNRVDELADPARMVPEIEAGIERILAENQIDSVSAIVFGSALWANQALAGEAEEAFAADFGTLEDWGRHLGAGPGRNPAHALWTLSGVPALFAAIAARVVEGSGARVLRSATGRVANLVDAERAAAAAGAVQLDEVQRAALDPARLHAALDEVSGRRRAALARLAEEAAAGLADRLERAQESFVARATAVLAEHVRVNGPTEWSYDVTGLRVLMRSAHASFARGVRRRCAEELAGAALEIERLVLEATGPIEGFAVRAPEPGPLPAPVMLGQTIALDLGGSWWSRWWKRRRSPEAFAREYAGLISEEVRGMVDGLVEDQKRAVAAIGETVLAGFMDDQRTALERLSGAAEDETGAADRLEELDEVRMMLGAWVDPADRAAKGEADAQGDADAAGAPGASGGPEKDGLVQDGPVQDGQNREMSHA